MGLDGGQGPVKVYDPTVGTEPIPTKSDHDSLTLTLTDHPLIVAIPTVLSPKSVGITAPR
jgi:hypothetical protein